MTCTAGRKILLSAKLCPMPPAHGLKGAISNPTLSRRKIALAALPLPCCSRSRGVNTNTLSGFARFPLWVLSNAGFLLLLPLWVLSDGQDSAGRATRPYNERKGAGV